jgi:hypothetical protein
MYACDVYSGSRDIVLPDECFRNFHAVVGG